jgi:hypothetical protein
MRKIMLVFLLGSALAQSQPHRTVRGQTLLSRELPAARFTLSNKFHYVGGHVINLYGNAEAEQHLFVNTHNGLVKSFYWLQFEHFLASNIMNYDYKMDRSVKIADLNFICDVKAYSDYPGLTMNDPGSDGTAIAQLAAAHHIIFPKRVARARMVFPPTPDRRTELMIIYGEAIEWDVPADRLSLDNLEVDTDKPGLKVRTRTGYYAEPYPTSGR